MPGKFRNKYRIDPDRWPYWDYSAPGGYFITICTKGRIPLFGKITGGQMILSGYGKIVETEFLQVPAYNKRARLDAYVVMPDHVHCIITLGKYDFDDGISHVGNGKETNNADKGCDFYPAAQPPQDPGSRFISVIRPWWYDPDHHPTLDEIKQYRKQRRKMIIPKLVGKFKMITSKQINRVRETPGRRNWQPGFHDHVIRDRGEYYRIRKYIYNNPRKG